MMLLETSIRIRNGKRTVRRLPSILSQQCEVSELELSLAIVSLWCLTFGTRSNGLFNLDIAR